MNNQVVVYNKDNYFTDGELIVNMKNKGEIGKIEFSFNENNELFLLKMLVPHYYKKHCYNKDDFKKMSHGIYLMNRINPNDFPKHDNEFDGAVTIKAKFGLRNFHNSGEFNDRPLTFPTSTDYLILFIFFSHPTMNLKTVDCLHPNGKWKTKTFYDMYNKIKKDSVIFYFTNFIKNSMELITGNRTTNFIKVILDKNDNISFNTYPNKLRFSETCFKNRINVNNIIIPK